MTIRKTYQLKVPSSVMMYALFVMVIVTILIGAVISIAYFNYLQRLNFSIEKQLQHNVRSGIALLLSNKTVEYDVPKQISLYGEDKDSVYLTKELFGMFDLIRSRSSWKKLNYEKVAWAGNYSIYKESPALYLADHSSPLCLVGQSVIEGNCYLPQRGARRGYIDGRTYEGDEFITGKIEPSKPVIPVLKKVYDQNTLVAVKNKYLKPERYKLLNGDEMPKEGLIHNFTEPAKIIYDTESILLENIKLKNNIVVISEREVAVSKTAELENILIYAPAIYIESGFQGTLQCFASDTLFIGSNVSLKYPSALCLIQKEVDQSHGILQMNRNASLKGVVCVDWSKNKTSQPYIFIDNNVLITGLLYSTIPVQFFGRIKGSAYVDGFYVKRHTGNYINHLLDVEISRKDLPVDFIGPDLFSEHTQNQIMEWLN